MAIQDEYLAQIEESQKSGHSVEIDFSQLPDGVDKDTIASALSNGIPEEYGNSVQQAASEGHKASLDYAKIPKAKPIEGIITDPLTKSTIAPIVASEGPSDFQVAEEKSAEQQRIAASKAVGQVGTAPSRGLRGAGVAIERGIAGDAASQALERGAEAVKPGYAMKDGERIGAIAGDLVGSMPLFVAMEPLMGAAAESAAARGAVNMFGQPSVAAAAAAKYGTYAIEGGAANSVFNTLGQMAEKGEVDGKDVLVAAGVGAVAGPVLGKSVELAGEAAQATGRLLAPVRVKIQTELNTAMYHVNKGLGIPQETGLVPYDVLAAVARHETEVARLEGIIPQPKPVYKDEFLVKSDYDDMIEKMALKNVNGMTRTQGAKLAEQVTQETLAMRSLKTVPADAFPDPVAPPPAFKDDLIPASSAGEGRLPSSPENGGIAPQTSGTESPAGKPQVPGTSAPGSYHPSVVGQPSFVKSQELAAKHISPDQAGNPSLAMDSYDASVQEAHDYRDSISAKYLTIPDGPEKDAMSKQVELLTAKMVDLKRLADFAHDPERSLDYYSEVDAGRTPPEGSAPEDIANVRRDARRKAQEASVLSGSDAPKEVEVKNYAKGISLSDNLVLKFGDKTYPIESVKHASEMWAQVRDAAADQGVTSKHLDANPRIVDASGKTVGWVSYNGRVWRGDNPGENKATEWLGDSKPESAAIEKGKRAALKPGPHPNTVEVDGTIYRVTPADQPKVPDIVKPGDMITTDAVGRQPSTYKVISVKGPHKGSYDFGKGQTRHTPEHYSVGVVDPGEIPNKNGSYRESDVGSVNELVAVDGKIHHLFYDNPEELRIHKAGEAPPPGFRPEGADIVNEAVQVVKGTEDSHLALEADGWKHTQAIGAAGLRTIQEAVDREFGPGTRVLLEKRGDAYQVYIKPAQSPAQTPSADTVEIPKTAETPKVSKTKIEKPKAKATKIKPKFKPMDALTTMRNTVPRKTTLPILQEFAVKDGVAYSTDLEVSVAKKIDSADGVYKFVGKDAVLNPRYKLVEDFPPVWGSKPAVLAGQVDREQLLDAVSKASLFASEDSTRLSLNQVMIHAEESGISVLATDGRRMFRVGIKGKLKPGFYGIPVSKISLNGLKSLTGDTVKIHHLENPGSEGTSTIISIDGDDGWVSMRQNQQTYPNYKQVWPQVNNHLEFDKSVLQAALDEIKPYLKANAKESVAFKIKGLNMEISVDGQTPKMVSVPVTIKAIAPALRIEGAVVMPFRQTDSSALFEANHQYISEAVNILDGDKVFLSRGDSPPIQVTDHEVSGRDDINEKPKIVKKKSSAPAAFEAEFDSRLNAVSKGSAVTLSRDLPAMPQAGIPNDLPANTPGKLIGVDYVGETLLVDFGNGPVRVMADDLVELGGDNRPAPVRADTSAYDIPVESFAKEASGPPGRGKGTLPTSTPQSFGVKMEFEAQTKDRTNKIAFTKKLESAFGVPVRGKSTHRFGKSKLGHYQTENHLIRMKRWGDLEVMSHEGGHAMDWSLRKSQGRRWLEKAIKDSGVDFQTAKAELLDLDYDQTKRRQHEGLAEFMRHWITTGNAAKEAPAFFKAFSDFLDNNEVLKKDLTELRDLYNTWREMGAEGRMRAQVDFTGELSKTSLREKADTAFEWFYDQFIDAGDALKRMEDGIAKATGKTLRPSQSPHARFTYFAQKARGVAYEMVMKGAVNWKGETVGPSLVEVLKPIETSWGDLFPNAIGGDAKVQKFITYALSRRALELAKRNIDAGFDLADVQYVFNKYHNPIWEKVSDGLTAWSNAGVDWLIEAGNMSQEQAQLMRDLNPVYLRLKRVFVNETHSAGSGSLSSANKGIKRIKGSGRPIYNPIESMIEEMANVVGVAQKSTIARLIGDLAGVRGAGKWVVKIPPPLESTELSLASLVDALKKEGIGSHVKEDGKIRAPEAEDLEGVATIFSNSQIYKGKDNVISVWRDGKREFYELDAKLFAALQALDAPKLNSYTKFTAPFVRLVRLGAVDLNPAFALIKNPERDALSYIIASRAPGKRIWDPAVGIYRHFTAKPGELPSRFEGMGGKMSGQVGYDRTATMAVYDAALLENLPKGKLVKVILHPVDFMRGVLSVGEAGPRISELERMYAHYRATKPEWTETDCWIQAVNDAQDVTVNFTRGGLFGRQVNQAVPFFNAAMQSLDKLARLSQEDPAGFAVYGIAYITIPALGMWALNREKQWYKNLPHEYKYGNFFFEIGDTVFRLPMPFEYGTVFGSTFIAAMESLLSKDNDNGRRGQALVNRALASLPGVWPMPLGPLADVKTNRDYQGRPIESEGMKYLPEHQRVRPQTMAISKAISAGLVAVGIPAVAFSPVQVEYLLNNYTGGQINSFRILGGLKELSDIPFAGAILVRAPENPARQLTILFGDLDDLRKKKKGDEITPQESQRLALLENIYKRVYHPQAKQIKHLIDTDASQDKIRGAYLGLQKSLESMGIP